MADFIVKCDPINLDKGAALITAPRYQKADPHEGDWLFIWFSEARGGQGLTARAFIEAVSDGDPVTLSFTVDHAPPSRVFGKPDLAPHRNTHDATVLSRLASKLYRHSLNKLAALDADEGLLLQSIFIGARLTERTPSAKGSKYEPLTQFLTSRGGSELIASFAEIESALGSPLPASAREPQWWANLKESTHVQRESWRRAGYDAFLLSGQDKVRFVKVR